MGTRQLIDRMIETFLCDRRNAGALYVLEQPLNLALVVETDGIGRRHLRQARHRHADLRRMTMGYAFYAVLNSLPQIAVAAFIPVAATIAVSFVVKSLRRRSGGQPIGID